MIKYLASMEQPLTREKKTFSISSKVKEETRSFLKLAAPMFGSQLALQLIVALFHLKAGEEAA